MKRKHIAALFILGMLCLSLFKMPVTDDSGFGISICSDLTDDFH